MLVKGPSSTQGYRASTQMSSLVLLRMTPIRLRQFASPLAIRQAPAALVKPVFMPSQAGKASRSRLVFSQFDWLAIVLLETMASHADRLAKDPARHLPLSLALPCRAPKRIGGRPASRADWRNSCPSFPTRPRPCSFWRQRRAGFRRHHGLKQVPRRWHCLVIGMRAALGACRSRLYQAGRTWLDVAVLGTNSDRRVRGCPAEIRQARSRASGCSPDLP